MDEQKFYEALLTIKEMCSKNFKSGDDCDCPCYVNGDCGLLTTVPKNIELKKRTVFL